MKENFTYTAPYSESHVSADLSAMAMLFIELMCEQQEQNKSYGELICTKNALAQFGFKNSQSAKLLGTMTEQMAEYKKATDTLAFMEDVWKKFGKDVMVVRYDHFFQILEKYDMVCGSFDRYTGGIPQEALDTLTRLNGMWKREELNSVFATPFEWGREFVVATEETAVNGLRNWMRIPILTTKTIKDCINDAMGIRGGVLDNAPDATALTDVLFIAAPAADMEPLEIKVEFETDKLKELRETEPKTDTSTLWMRLIRLDSGSAEYLRLMDEYGRLCSIRSEEIRVIEKAVKDEEERLKSILADSDINRYAQISFIHKEAEIARILKDPFICSLTPYGVLIHAKWGPEAEDATIKRYEQLRDAVIGKGGAE